MNNIVIFSHRKEKVKEAYLNKINILFVLVHLFLYEIKFLRLNKGIICFGAIMFALCSVSLHTQAQKKAEEIRPVKIGERVPDLLWDTPMTFYKNGKYVTETLKQYKGKVIVFDFWATWCGTCIDGFPKLRQLQDSLVDGLQVVLVNQKGAYDSNESIERTFAANKSQLGNLPTVIQDTLLHRLFSTYALPSYAVITGDWDLSGITLSFMFHAEDIKALVAYRTKLLKVRAKIKAGQGRSIR